MSAEGMKNLYELLGETSITDSQQDHTPSLPSETSDDEKTGPITIQVGDRRFTTLRSTLTDGSPFFTALLSSQWARPQVDGSYFVDADELLFTHILRFLRSGTLPVFYTSGAGHDYGMYAALLSEAQYFQIDRLTGWLKNKEYEKAVKVEHSIDEFEGLPMAQLHTSNMQVEYHSARITRKIYICPRGIEVHRGNSSACGRACKNAQGSAAVEFEEEEVLKILAFSKTTIFKPEQTSPP